MTDGANGDTFRAMLETLQLQIWELTGINGPLPTAKHLRTRSKVELAVANSLCHAGI